MRQIELDEFGPLVYRKRRKSIYKHVIGSYQQDDGWLIQKCALMYLPKSYSFLYTSEWADCIEDFEQLKYNKKKNGECHLMQVSFDHVLFIANKYVIIFESDDPSHYDSEYCLQRKWDYKDIILRDCIKNIWSQRTDTLLVRLPQTMSTTDKQILIKQAIEKICLELP